MQLAVEKYAYMHIENKLFLTNFGNSEQCFEDKFSPNTVSIESI
jgi:hypothetical protein